MTETDQAPGRGKIICYHSTLPEKRRKSKVPRRGYDLIANATGAKFLLDVCKTLREGASASPRIDFSPPDRKLVATTSEARVLQSMVIEVRGDLPALVESSTGRPQRGVSLRMQIEGTHLQLILSRAGLYEFEEGVQDLSQGGGDYALWGEGPDEGLWFWEL
jgi:hypothetical protein